ncbi:GPO family capsid scaffolding protein [Salmonella enterica]|nr:GPO family capsid scaffolding protein [Salmonella enterica]HEC8458454.1 GPO family capsid scaffolding protein [Salmonella enterica subsp. enterica serovar Poona]
MAKQKYTTDWICVATEGYAIDGRTITRETIQQAADNYDTSVYTAMIWPHHPIESFDERQYWTPNLGLVSELATQKVAGRLRLMAKLEPNQRLIDLNESGQKLFTSCEFMSDYANTGQVYLVGLAATDIPASLGTGRMNLSESVQDVSAPSKQYTALSNIEMFSLGRLTPAAGNSSPDDENHPMNKAIANKLLTAVLNLTAKVDAQMNTQAQTQQPAQAPAATDTQPQQATQDFSAHANNVAELTEKLSIAADTLAASPEDATARQNYAAAATALQTTLSAFTVQQNAEDAKLQARIAARNGGQQPTAAQNLSAKPDLKSDDADDATMTMLTSAIENLSQRFAAIEGQRTPTPGAAPSGQPAQFEPL